MYSTFFGECSSLKNGRILGSGTLIKSIHQKDMKYTS